jgi:Spy/CpxP family protein refolding chaperone
MKQRFALVGALMLSVGFAGLAVAQQDTTAPQRPMRMRQHVPGTGMADSTLPMRQRMGPGMPGMRGMPGMPGMQRGIMRRGFMGGEMDAAAMAVPGARFYAPGALLGRKTLLALTDQQVTQLETLRTDVQAAMDKARADSRTNLDALRKAWDAARPDATAIRNSAQALMQSHQAAMLAALNATVQAKALLTAEQQAKMDGWVAGQRRGAGIMRRGMVGRGMRGMRRPYGIRGGMMMRRPAPPAAGGPPS